MIGMSDSYWKYRRARLAMKRPEFALLDILLFAGSRDKGERMPYLDQCKAMYAQGQYYTDRAFDMTKNFFNKIKDYFKGPESAFDRTIRLKDKDWDDIDRSEATGSGNTGRAESEPEFTRMDPEPSTAVGRPRAPHEEVDVKFTPDSPENRVASNRVGPERQITESSEPFPLAKPDPDKTAAKRDPFAVEDLRSEEEKAKKDSKSTEIGKTKEEGSPLPTDKDKKVSSIEDARKKKEDEKTKEAASKAAKKRRADRDDMEL